MKRNGIFQISLFLLPIFESFQFRRDIELKKEKENSVVQSKTIDNQGEEENFPFLGSRVKTMNIASCFRLKKFST